MLNDAVKYSKITYALSGVPADIEGVATVVETNVSITKLAEEILKKAEEQDSDSPAQTSRRTAQTYFAHKLIHVSEKKIISTWSIEKYLFSLQLLIEGSGSWFAFAE